MVAVCLWEVVWMLYLAIHRSHVTLQKIGLCPVFQHRCFVREVMLLAQNPK